MPQFYELPNNPFPAINDLVALQAEAGGPGSSYNSTLAQLFTFTVLVDGSQPLTADWDAGEFTIKSRFLHGEGTDDAAGAYQIIAEGAQGGWGAGISFQSLFTGGSMGEMARITADSEATWNTTVDFQDAYLRFFTCLNGVVAEKVRIDSDGDLLLGTTTKPTGTIGKVLVFGDNAGDPTMGANTAGIYAKDVSGTVTLYALNEGGTAYPVAPQNLSQAATPQFTGVRIGSSADGFSTQPLSIVGSGMAGTYYASLATQRFQYLCRRARGTADLPAAVVDEDAVGIFSFQGYDGTAFQQAAQIQCTVDGAVSSGSVPMRISFVTGSSVADREERMRILSDGNIMLGGSSTSPTLSAALTDAVLITPVDNGAGNRELQVQPELGGLFAWGNNKFRRVPAATRDVEHITASVNTTDDTQTTLATIPISAGYTYQIDAVVMARRTGGTAGAADDGASYHRRAVYTTKAGVVTLMGSIQTIGTDAEDQAGWDVTLDISTTNVRVRVTGASDNNITWFADITVRRVAS